MAQAIEFTHIGLKSVGSGAFEKYLLRTISLYSLENVIIQIASQFHKSENMFISKIICKLNSILNFLASFILFIMHLMNSHVTPFMLHVLQQSYFLKIFKFSSVVKLLNQLYHIKYSSSHVNVVKDSFCMLSYSIFVYFESTTNHNTINQSFLSHFKILN